MTIIRKIANAIAKTEFARNAINDGADLSAFREKPSARIVGGIFLTGISYVIGLPLVGLLGVLSVCWREPLLIVIGGPVLFVLAHLVFLAGVYLAGGKYFMTFLRWATRVVLEKLISPKGM